MIDEEALRVIAQVAERPVAEVRPEHELVADLEIDSPKALRLLLALEDELDLEITDDEAAGLHTVGDVLACLRAKV